VGDAGASPFVISSVLANSMSPLFIFLSTPSCDCSFCRFQHYACTLEATINLPNAIAHQLHILLLENHLHLALHN
jgi:hypothetical protein